MADITTITQTQTMSSLQIAELTGKRHANVMRDISNLLEQGVNELNFELVEYRDAKGEKRPCYQLTKTGCLILASGYNAVLREKIINRWIELETASVKPLTQGQMLVQMAQAYEAQERMLLEQQEKQRIMETQIHRLECATDVNYGFMAVLGYAKLHGIAITRKVAATIGKAVSKYCRENKIQYGSQKHPIFGNVNIYPDHALQAVFPKFFPNTVF